MTPRGYVQRLVARHAEPLALRPRATPRFGPSPLSVGDADVERASLPRHVSSADGARGFTPPRSVDAGRPEDLVSRAPLYGAPPSEPGAGSVDTRGLANGSPVADLAGRKGPPYEHAGRKGLPYEAAGRSAAYGEAGDEGAPDDASSMRRTASVSDPRPTGRTGLTDDVLDMDARDRSSIATGRRLGGLPRDPQPVGVADSIHVHIGRIEVRAVTPPPDRPVTSARAAGPEPLSLDSYLARRARQ